MDDLLKSLKTELEAVDLCKDLMKMLARGGFNLTKWTSNSVTVLEQLECGDAAAEFRLSGPPDLHVLGVKWCVRDDSLVVSRGTMKSVSHDCTQREILSLVSSVFDPLGVVAPFTIRSRLILKAIWQTQGQAWDNPVSPELRDVFHQWMRELPEVQQVVIPRVYFTGSPCRLELHVFGDASLDAMCSVMYLRAEVGNTVQLAFVVGKTRVAPFRNTTIPKLELQASVIACRLSSQAQQQLECQFDKIVYWSDSTDQWSIGRTQRRFSGYGRPTRRHKFSSPIGSRKFLKRRLWTSGVIFLET